MQFEIFGPYEIPRNGRLVSGSRRDHRPFWEEVESDCEGLSFACGCYVLVIRNRAWYVGLAESQSFNPECFSSHKIVQYNAALQMVTGRPSLILIAKLTPQGRFAHPSVNGHRDAHFLENLLIGLALGRNPDLQNARGTGLLREMRVPGLLNTGRGQARALPVQALKEALGI
jgi:hypothetical protein